MLLKPSKQQVKDMEEEIDLALEENELTMTNYSQNITIIVNGGTQMFWTPTICKTCGKPALLHDANQEVCTKTIKGTEGFHNGVRGNHEG